MTQQVRGRRVIPRASLAAVLLAGACLRVAVESEAPEPSPTRTGAATVWIYAWGLATTPKVTADCGATHVYKATVHTNVGGFLLGLITLGFVVPAHVDYVCAAEAGVIEGEPPPPPPP
jgi:hypothetical protein